VLITLQPSALLRLVDDEREAAYEQWLADVKAASTVMRNARRKCERISRRTG
jgi:hypothetical protein